MPSVASAAKKLERRSGSSSAPALRLTASIMAMPMRASCMAEMASTAAPMSTTSDAETTAIRMHHAAPVEQQRDQRKDQVERGYATGEVRRWPVAASPCRAGLKARPR